MNKASHIFHVKAYRDRNIMKARAYNEEENASAIINAMNAETVSKFSESIAINSQAIKS